MKQINEFWVLGLSEGAFIGYDEFLDADLDKCYFITGDTSMAISWNGPIQAVEYTEKFGQSIKKFIKRSVEIILDDGEEPIVRIYHVRKSIKIEEYDV